MPRNGSYRVSKQEILRDYEIDKTKENRWPQRWETCLLENERTDNILNALEARVGRILRESGACNQDRTVSLCPLAEFLKIDLNIYNSGNSAIIYLENGKWVTHVHHRTRKGQREALAHEIGHALLYRNRDGSINKYTWNAGTSSILEERIAEYAARLILMPEDFVRHRVENKASGNIKEKLAREMDVYKGILNVRLKELEIVLK